jgi:hypothetical protein
MRSIAIFLTLVMVNSILTPAYLHATTPIQYRAYSPLYYNFVPKKSIVLAVNEVPTITKDKEEIPGGPDQPEVQSFSPIGMSDMVSPFSGDFTYNIPLLDVDGYPVNIAYNAGVTMDQEATWVGLGWNLNPGVINRVMRGVPDDFKGDLDPIVKKFNMKKDWTLGITGAASGELFGLDDLVKLGISTSLNYNNYNGFSSSFSVTPSIGIAATKKTELNFSLGLSGSSQGGASVSPKFSIDKKEKDASAKVTTTKSLNIGTSFNSRGGFNGMSYSYSKTKSQDLTTKVTRDGKTKDVETENAVTSSSSSGSSFNVGQPTYVPNISMPKNGFGLTLSFKFGPTLMGYDASATFSGFISKKWLKNTQVTQLPYGYFHLASGQNNEDATLDFNRENDGAFTPNTHCLPVPMLTYDMFNVSGHGVSGSYRPYRRDVGYVFDPAQKEGNVDASIGAEAGLGATAKAGVDVAVTYSDNKTGVWDNLNFTKVGFNDDTKLFREANEMSINNDLSHFNSLGGYKPVKFQNSSPFTLFNKLVDINGAVVSNLSNFNKPAEVKRSQPMYPLTILELRSGYGINSIHPNTYLPPNGENNHHIGQFTTLSTDGTRYIYGIPAYNISQKDVSFAIGTNGSYPILPPYSVVTGNIQIPSGANTENNDYGTDHYFNSTETPDYAHSYLLTNVLNADYVDSDNVPGPSKEDLGGYIAFDYNKIDDYLWRNPIAANSASYDEGLNTYTSDDKGHYNYGVKELWYVKTVKTKNHVLIFHTSNRKDAISVQGENGGLNANGPAMQKLDSISLFTIPEYYTTSGAINTNATPIKRVHFEYSYELCDNYPGNIDGNGKLTLKSVYFTYEGSDKGRNNRYRFNYGENYPYDMKSADRWSNYKERPANGLNVMSDALRPSDFPYVGQDKVQVDKWVAAWCMKEIKLPSGGRIEVDYESDDYQYVQNKRAMEMFRIVGVESLPGFNVMTNNTSVPVSDIVTQNKRLIVEVDPNFNPSTMNVNSYVSGIENVYFRALADFKDGRFDYVPGWAQVSDVQYESNLSNPTHKYISILLTPAKLNDNGSAIYNPLSVAAINFGRMQLSKVLPPSGQDLDDGTGLKDLALAMLGQFTVLGELFTGPNKALWDREVGTKIVTGKAWLRLNTIDGSKLGGGHRVKQIRMYDAWEEMTGIPNSTYFYGQEFDYKLDDGNSAGVAHYEPQMGNDENPWKQPVFYKTEKLLAPDDVNYQETPFGEHFFPSASVGYRKVTIRDLQRANVERSATGKVVHEFYTSKDFPTIAKKTNVNPKRFELPIQAIFFNMSLDFMSASQGFMVANNDMSGKPKAQRVYNQGGDKISSVEYYYRLNSDGSLNNEVAMIGKNGAVTNGTIGLSYESVADFRKSSSKTIAGSIDFNFNALMLPIIIVPTIWGSATLENTVFKSSSFAKNIEQFGIQERTVAEDLGSKVETKNLAYDAETGAVLLTETATNFEDKVYSFSYPAHWVYDNMGQAFKNIDVTADISLAITNGYTNLFNNNSFFIGDEVGLLDAAGILSKCWVTETSSSSIRIMKKNGDYVNGSFTQLKVLRSGNRNIAATSVGSITLRDNPLDNLTTNIFEKVLQAGAVEYVEDWRTFCECFSVVGSSNYTKNPYVLGLKGTWRPKASWTHLTGRTQSFLNNNTNIRQDGMFTSFTPFFKNIGSDWLIDKQNWTFVSSVKEFSPFGQALETVDALGRSSSSQFGYNQTFTTAVAANTKYRELGYDGFEDYDYQNCADKHFKLAPSTSNISSTEAHTGKRSIRVANGSPITLTSVIVEDCADITACDIKMTVVYNAALKSYVFNFTGGTAPYQYTNELIPVSVYNVLIMTDTGFNVKADQYEQFEVKIQVVDATGCVFNATYKPTNI